MFTQDYDYQEKPFLVQIETYLKSYIYLIFRVYNKCIGYRSGIVTNNNYIITIYNKYKL
jgi:hypothetical protein